MRNYEQISYKDNRLNTFLEKLNESDLESIKIEYSLNGNSELNKDEIIHHITENYPKMVRHISNFLTNDEFKLILNCFKNDGLIVFDESNPQDITKLFCFGLVFLVEDENQHYLAIPNELIEWLRQSDITNLTKKSIQNSYINQFVIGIVNLYGVVSLKYLIRLYQEQNKVLLDLKFFYELINLFDEYDDYFHIIGHNEYVCHYHVKKNSFSLIREVKSRNDINYYPFTKEQILNAGHKDYIQSNKDHQELILYIIKNIKGIKAPLTLNKDMYYLAVSGQIFLEAIKLVVSEEEILRIPNLNKFIKLYIDFSNHIYQWPLKGNSILFDSDELKEGNYIQIGH